VVRAVAQEWAHDEVAGTVVCRPVIDVSGFLAQER
jgi:hypothetical protein